MDPKLKAIMELIESKRKTNFPWTRQEPYNQPYYSYSPSEQTWKATTPPVSNSTSNPPSTTITNITILSWNIDFMLPFSDLRMTRALNHLSTLTQQTTSPSFIFLQEMLVSDLALIQSTPWIQTNYNITDIDDRHWESGHYGTCTLIPKSLPITSVFRVHYSATKMERDALFVDVAISQPSPLRLCNTHLESLVADPPLRPQQVSTAAPWMKASDTHGSILGGDLNAIQPFDRTLHSDNGLQDAYLETGGQEGVDDGFTWGQMAQVKLRKMFGCSRMDKLFYCGGLEVLRFERFGLGVEVDDEEAKKKLVAEEGLDGGWVTDHLGVMGEFKVVPASASRL